MSYTTLHEFNKGFRKIRSHEYGNSWGSLPRIWDPLFDKYLRKDRYDNSLSSEATKNLVKIYNENHYPMFERVTYGLTLDGSIVTNRNFKKVAEYLEEFESIHPRKKDFVNHVPKFIEVLKTSKADKIGIWLTSICEDPWDIPIKKRLEVGFDILDELEQESKETD